MKLIFLGPPGAGKGTHAKVLAENFGLSHLAAGDCLRRHLKENTALGKKAKDFIQRGELVPDDLVNEMMAGEIVQALGTREGFILDGYPRTVAQAEYLDALCGREGWSLDAAVNFKTSEEVVIGRLGGRLVCSQCGGNYHKTNIPPRVEGICDKCGAPLTQRKDDNPETIRRRLEVYVRETAPLIDYYRNKGILRDFDGDQGLEPLRGQLSRFFESLKSAK